MHGVCHVRLPHLGHNKLPHRPLQELPPPLPPQPPLLKLANALVHELPKPAPHGPLLNRKLARIQGVLSVSAKQRRLEPARSSGLQGRGGMRKQGERKLKRFLANCFMAHFLSPASSLIGRLLH